MTHRKNGIEVRIPTFGWKQIGGDMSADKYGGLIAEADGSHIELLEIQPVREYIGDEEAREVGHPFWTKEAWFDESDLDTDNKDVRSALDSIGMSLDDLRDDFTPEQRALVIAEALIGYGSGDEGPAGWSSDIYPERIVDWSYGGKQTMGEYLADEDAEFRREVLEEEDEEDEDEEGREELEPNISADLKKRYEFFKTFGGGGRVGHAAEGALALARAEKIAEDRGWEATWEPEEGPWEDYLGDYDKIEDIDEVAYCVLKDESGRVLASLGGITLSKKSSASETRHYKRYTEAELALEAAMNARLL